MKKKYAFQFFYMSFFKNNNFMMFKKLQAQQGAI